MLDDNQREKDMMRNQMIAIVLMTLLVIVWFQFAKPPQKPPTEPLPPQDQSAGAQPEDGSETPGAGSKDAREASPLPALEEDGADFLPPLPIQDDPAGDEVVIADDSLELTFTRIGARLKRARVLLGELGEHSIQLVPEAPDDSLDANYEYPMGLGFSDEAVGEALNRRRFEAEPGDGGRSVTFRIDLPGHWTLVKRFWLDQRPFVCNAAVSIESTADVRQVLGMDNTPAYAFSWGPNVNSGDKTKMVRQGVYWRMNGQVEGQVTAKIKHAPGKNAFELLEGPVDWAAIKSAYFVVALQPLYEQARLSAEGVEDSFRVGLTVPRFELAPGESHEAVFAVYMGPNMQAHLAQAWPTLPEVFRIFTAFDAMDWFAKLLLSLLNWFHNHLIANYGFAIIFLTILVRMVMYPLTLKSMRSMKKMQVLAPEIEKLREKCKDDPQELNKQMMELYKERGVNPFGGCFPLLLQMPIFIALYRMLANAFELRGAPFILWIQDLSEPDRLLHIPALADMPLVGMFEYLNLLPLLMGASMVLSQKVMPTSGPAQNDQQKMMMTIMPVFFAFICYSMASGLNLYILTSTVLGMVQQKFTHVNEDETKKDTKKRPRKPQHFYAAAQARKRELAKAAKAEKKKVSGRKRGGKPKGSGK